MKSVHAWHPTAYTSSSFYMHASRAAHVSCVLAVDAKNAVKDAASKAAAGAQRMAGLDPKQGASMLLAHSLSVPQNSAYASSHASHRIACMHACVQRA